MKFQGSIEGLRRQVQAMRAADGEALLCERSIFVFLWRMAAELHDAGDTEAARLYSEMASLRTPSDGPLKPGMCKGCGAWRLDYCEPWCAAQSNPPPKKRHAHRKAQRQARRQPNYMPALTEAVRAHQGAGVFSVQVEHDDRCCIWRGEPCNCNPVVHTPRAVR